MQFALLLRIVFLIFISWIMTLTQPLFNIAEWFNNYNGDLHECLSISGRDLILIFGGLFLIYKSNLKYIKALKGQVKSNTKKQPHFGAPYYKSVF